MMEGYEERCEMVTKKTRRDPILRLMRRGEEVMLNA